MSGIDLSTLNDPQRTIAQTLDRPLFVEAGAGSGKTFTLTQRIAWALAPGSGADGRPYLDSLDQVLVITFTNAAAREIKERVRSTLRRAGMREAALQVDDAWISTIHGMCSRILHRHALDLGLDPEFKVANENLVAQLRYQATNEVIGAAQREARSGGPLSGAFAELGYSRVESLVEKVVECAHATPGGFDRLYLPEGGDLAACMGRLLNAVEALGACKVTPKAREKLTPSLEALRAFGQLPPGQRDAGHAQAALEAVSLPRSSKAIAEALPEAKAALAEARALVPLEACRAWAEPLVGLAAQVDARFGQLKRQKSVLDNDDLVSLALASVRSNPAVAGDYAGRFRLVMVDEFQDTDAEQLELITLLAGGADGPLATVGDAQQSIYRFRGADVSVFRSRGAGMPGENRVRLDTNYRSHADVLAFVERVCGGGAGRRGVLEGFMHLDANPKRKDAYKARDLPRIDVELTSGPSASGGPLQAQSAVMAAMVADRFQETAAHGQSAGDMALLLGVTTHADLYIDAIRARGLECVVTGGSTFSSAPEVFVVCALLHTLANPHDTQSGLFPLLASEMFGLDANDFVLLGTRQQDKLDAPTKRGVDRGIASMEFFHGLCPSRRLVAAREAIVRALAEVRHRPVADVCLDAIRDSGWLARLEAEGAQGAAREANVLAAVEYVRALTEDLGLGPARAAAEFDLWLRAAKVPPASLAGGAMDTVRVMTIHASKGLEFPVVACAECWGNATASTGVLSGRVATADGDRTALVVATDAKAADALQVEGEPGNLAEWASVLRARDVSEGNAEKARLLYVGMTRAREALILALSCVTTKAGVGPLLAAGTADALFGGCLPQAGEGTVDFGGTQPARVRHVAITRERGALPVADSAGTLPALDGELPEGASETVLLGTREAGSDSEGSGVAPFELFEAEAAPTSPVSLHRAREGVFSYSMVHKAAGAHAQPALTSAAQSADAAGERPARRRAVWEGESLPTRAERDAEQEGAPFTADEDKATNLGSAFHELAQAMVESGHELPPQRVRAMEDYWRLGVRQRPRLEAALERWSRSDLRREALSHARVRAEVPFFVRVEGSEHGDYVEGAIDLLCTDPGSEEALVVDYKTGDLGLAYDEVLARHRMQANFYAYVLMRQGFLRVRCAFVCVEREEADGQPTVVRYAFDESRPPKI